MKMSHPRECSVALRQPQPPVGRREDVLERRLDRSMRYVSRRLTLVLGKATYVDLPVHVRHGEDQIRQSRRAFDLLHTGVMPLDLVLEHPRDPQRAIGKHAPGILPAHRTPLIVLTVNTQYLDQLRRRKTCQRIEAGELRVSAYHCPAVNQAAAVRLGIRPELEVPLPCGMARPWQCPVQGVRRRPPREP